MKDEENLRWGAKHKKVKRKKKVGWRYRYKWNNGAFHELPELNMEKDGKVKRKASVTIILLI